MASWTYLRRLINNKIKVHKILTFLIKVNSFMTAPQQKICQIFSVDKLMSNLQILRGHSENTWHFSDPQVKFYSFQITVL